MARAPLLALIVAGLFGLRGVPLSAQTSPATVPPGLVGTYDGGQMEVAAGLELRRDGRFRYGLSYGALDEEAEGSWRAEGQQVLLTSDPITPPRFVLLDRRAAPAGSLRIGLTVPDGLSRQYFHAEVRLADGSTVDRQLSDDQDPIDLAAISGHAVVTVTLPMFDLSSEPVSVPDGGGQEISFRFEPHDLGKASFSRTPLRIEHGVLVMNRFDRTIRFRHRPADARSDRP